MTSKWISLSVLMALAAASQANFVVNGDFESDPYPAADRTELVTLTGWEIGTAGNVHGIGKNYNYWTGFQVRDTQELDLSEYFNGEGIFQTLNHNLVGQELTITFDLYTNGTGIPSQSGGANFWMDGQMLGFALGAEERTRYTYTFTPSGNSSVIAFGSQLGNMVLLDNVEVVPEPATLTALGMGAAFLLRKRRRA